MNQNLDTSTASSETVLTSERLHEHWSGANSSERTEDPSHRILTEIVRGGGDRSTWIRQPLIRLQDLTGAERLFLFDVTGSASALGDAPRSVDIGPCLLSIDFDREPVSKPESRVPMEILRLSLRGKRPIWALDTLQDGPGSGVPQEVLSRIRGCAAVPLRVRGVCHGLLYFEHRFQPIRIVEREADCALSCVQALAVGCALRNLEKENQSLWLDLMSLREKWKASESLSVEPVTSATPKVPSGEGRNFQGDYSAIIGSSPLMMEIFNLLDRIRGSKAPVLIIGESGTGKELIATAIHRNSPRKDRNFVSENCGALTETLLESELFGYVKGAFTGAHKDHKGLFELAHGGTLFLDEVGDMSAGMQKKLLRAIQEEKIRRVGGKEYISVDVRIVSATNKDLLHEVRRGNFREDLYYRLNVINIRAPALRERREDIPELTQSFVSKLVEETGVKKTISSQAMQLMMKYPWPGNIRELQNEVKRAFALSDSRMDVPHLSDPIRKGSDSDLLLGHFEDNLQGLTLKEAVETVEKALIKQALLDAEGNKSQVAKQLKIPKTSLYNKISKYGLEREIQENLF